MIAPEIFKAYDIRGIVGRTLTMEAARAIGAAIGSEALDRGLNAIVVGRDGRVSGPELSSALMHGLIDSGVDVIDIGRAPTPLVYFAAHHLGVGSAVAVTGSHNPADWNGFKIVLGGETLGGEAIQKLRWRIEEHGYREGRGELRHAEVLDAYIDRIAGDVHLARPIKLVIDCGNGIAGIVAPELFRRLGCAVIELYCEVDGRFPNHHPDPSRRENLRALQQAVAANGAEIGLAFDGDGDRLGVVTCDGGIIWPDRLMMLFAADVLSRVPGGEIVFDVKCSRLLTEAIRQHGGRPVMWRTGHAPIKARLKESGAPLAGEMSGHIFFAERWYGFDDGLYAGARLLEIVARAADASAPLLALPDTVATPELNLRMNEGEPKLLVERLLTEGRFPTAQQIVTVDGVRAEYADGFGLARASNTTPVVVLRFEADDAAALARIQDEFRAAIDAVWPGLTLDFDHGGH